MADLTGTIPEQASTSLAGASHTLSLITTYYTAEVPIWLDLISSPSEWSESFLSPEAKEVLEVLGGLIVVFALPAHADSEEGKAWRDLIQHVGRVVKEGLGGWEWDGVSLCLGVGEIDDVDVWEDCCADSGLEFVQVRSQSTPSRNEFGGKTIMHISPLRNIAHIVSSEKTGIPRALEALEANDWANASADDLGSDFEDIDAEMDAHRKRQDADDEREDTGAADLDPRDLDFGFDAKDFEGLKRAIWTAGKDEDEDLIDGNPGTAATDGEKRTAEETEESLDDEDIQKIERMMTKLQAVKESNAGLPEDQRKRAAAKAVAEVMREL